MRSKQYIFFLLLFVSLIIVGMPVIPHHHHGDGIVCMKDDIKADDCCSAAHHHHHQEDDPCCTDSCTAHIQSFVSHSHAIDMQPDYLFAVILFTEPLLRFLTRPLPRDSHRDYVYREPLHSTYIARATGLRAPPSLV